MDMFIAGTDTFETIEIDRSPAALLQSLKNALADGRYLDAILEACTLPDICASYNEAMSDTAPTNYDRDRKWCDTYVTFDKQLGYDDFKKLRNATVHSAGDAADGKRIRYSWCADESQPDTLVIVSKQRDKKGRLVKCVNLVALVARYEQAVEAWLSESPESFRSPDIDLLRGGTRTARFVGSVAKSIPCAPVRVVRKVQMSISIHDAGDLHVTD